MSFNWKGLLGVNSSSQGSTSSSLNSISPNAASSSKDASTPGPSSAAGVATHTPASASIVSGTLGAFGNSYGASLPGTQPPKLVVNPNPFAVHQPSSASLFSGMVNPALATPLSPSTGLGGLTPAQPRKPHEIPINLAEGGGPLLGMENFGNTCYVNSMIQSLYFCRPFRDSLLSYPPLPEESDHAREDGTESAKLSVATSAKGSDAGTWPKEAVSPPETLFASLRDLFEMLSQTPPLPNPTTPTISSFPNGSLTSPSPSSMGGPGGGIMRKASTLSRPSTAGATPGSIPSGRGGLGAAAAQATPNNATGGAAAMAIPIAPGSMTGSGQPSLSISIGANGTTAAASTANGFVVDSQAVKGFIGTLKRENVMFDSTMHQDAHEMLNFVLNKVGEDLVDAERSQEAEGQTQPGLLNGPRKPSVRDVGTNGSTCVHRLFEGTLTNETRCLTCETVTSRDESFLDLSIDIEQNASVTSCLRQFSASEMLRSRNKFFCDSCSGLQEAEKRMKIKKLPNVLALHLKRFKYEESIQRFVKLAYRVAFPLELRLFNTSDDAEDPDRLYELFGIVVHIGAGPHHGHYIAIIKVGTKWVLFDDDHVCYIDELEISKYYGDRPGLGSAYVLFYQAVDLDFEGLGMKRPATPTPAAVDIQPNSALGTVDRDRLGINDELGPRSLGPSPERTGSMANRIRLGFVSESTALTSPGGAISLAGEAMHGQSPSVASEASGGSGWFGSFRNRTSRTGSQSQRRPRTASAIESLNVMPTGTSTPASVVDSSVAPTPSSGRGALASEDTPSDAASVVTGTSGSLTSSNSLSRAKVSPAAAGLTPAAETSLNEGRPAADVLMGSSGTESTLDQDGSPLAVRKVELQARAEANRERREENLMQARWNQEKRVRADSESMISSYTSAAAPLPDSGVLGPHPGGFVTDAPLTEEPTATLQPPAAPIAAEAKDSVTPTLAIVGLRDEQAINGAPTSSAAQRLSSGQPAGASFAPANRPISKKEQKQIAKTSRRASSSIGYGGGSHLSHAATAGDMTPSKSTGVFSNLFGSGQSSNAASELHSRRLSVIGGEKSPSFASGQAPTRKANITTRSLSRTFGFGRSNKS